MNLDKIDIKILMENFDANTVNELDEENVKLIFNYLNENGIYYSKDLFLTSLDLFLLPCNLFIKKFENLKNKLGEKYADLLANDNSLIEIMYED